MSSQAFGTWTRHQATLMVTYHRPDHDSVAQNPSSLPVTQPPCKTLENGRGRGCRDQVVGCKMISTLSVSDFHRSVHATENKERHLHSDCLTGAECKTRHIQSVNRFSRTRWASSSPSRPWNSGIHHASSIYHTHHYAKMHFRLFYEFETLHSR